MACRLLDFPAYLDTVLTLNGVLAGRLSISDASLCESDATNPMVSFIGDVKVTKIVDCHPSHSAQFGEGGRASVPQRI